MRPIRLAMLCLAVLALVPAAAGTAQARPATLTLDRGVVQSASATRLVLRELDGRLVTVTVGSATRVRINGRAGSVLDVAPGFVAAAVHDGEAPAVVVRAFGRVVVATDRGVVVSVVARRLTIRTASGQALVFQLTARTRIRRRGLPAPFAALRPGRLVDVGHDGGGRAVRVVVRLRAAV